MTPSMLNSDLLINPWLQITTLFKGIVKFRVDLDWTVGDSIWYCLCLSGVVVENWLKDVYMCQNDTCEIISQSDHSFNSYDQNSKFSISLDEAY